MAEIAKLGLDKPITLILDNARYQKCALVQNIMKSFQNLNRLLIIVSEMLTQNTRMNWNLYCLGISSRSKMLQSQPFRVYIENSKRVMYPDKLEEFMSIQRMFAQKIREQGWLDSGIKLKRK